MAVIILLTIVAYLPAGSLTASVPLANYGPDTGSLSWLRTEQGQIVDEAGRKVLLRGFNDDALVAYPKDPPAPIDESDATSMQQAGFDVVRLGIDWSQLEPVRGRFDQAYLDRVASTVAMLNRHDLYVVLDMHFRLGWSPRFGYSGAPGWATIGAPNWNPLPQYSWSPSLVPAAIASEMYFWLSSDWKTDFYRAWQAVATRFKDTAGVAGYDIFNEAHPLPIPPRIFEKFYLWPMFKDSIEAIGAVDAKHLFFVQGILFLNVNTVVVHLTAPNVVYGTHLYEGSLIPPFWAGDPTFLRQRFQERVKEAAQLPAPLWIGEFGYDLTQKGALSYADAALDDADNLGIGWAWWQWRENRYWGIVDASGQIVNMEALRHLARPYLIAAPSGVHLGHADGVRGTLSIGVDASHADQSILIGWSALTLAAPVAQGPCLNSSHWDAIRARLTLQVDRGAGCRLTVATG
ncbi:MAG TPA: cellulase family glycosylhydrolase [Candidatus Dormibacteraeota bacterium]|nr:cellulase family glycosylhydrolase [Candidatus Dormibacteraeota bacterium]